MTSTLLEEVAAGRAPALAVLTADQVHRMLESGILNDGDPIELIEGVLVLKDRSLDHDRTTKRRLYAQAGIPTYWIANARDGRLEVHAQPEPERGDYRHRVERAAARSRLDLDAGAWLDVPVSDLLGA